MPVPTVRTAGLSYTAQVVVLLTHITQQALCVGYMNMAVACLEKEWNAQLQLL
jgi:hypothetical protein